MVEVLNDNPTDSINIPTLNIDPDAFAKYQRSYDAERDIFFVYKVPKQGAISLDIGGHLWLRYAPESGEVIGMEIEDFEEVFLAKYPEMRLAWKKVKPRFVKPAKKKAKSAAEYIRMLILFIKGIMREHPHQGRLAMT